MKKFIVILMVLLLFSIPDFNVFGAEDIMEVTNDENGAVGEELIETHYSNSETNIIQSLTGYSFLYDLGNIINYLGNGLFSLGGYTETNNTVDSITTQVYLQRYNTSSKTWSTVYDFSNSQNNSFRVSAYDTYTATTGYYYRIYVSHTARKGNVTETATSYSETIYAY